MNETSNSLHPYMEGLGTVLRRSRIPEPELERVHGFSSDSSLLIPDFDEESHVYRYDGRVVPSVTGIIRAAGIGHTDTVGSYEIPDDVMEAARDRGTDVHLATALADQNELDWDSLDDEITPYVVAYEAWRSETGFVPTMIEQPVYCAEYDYAGTPDRVGYIGDQLTFIDIKTGSGLKPWHQIQLAAYAYAVGGDKWPVRIVLELKSTTKRGYTAYRFQPTSATWDFSVFKACRILWTHKELCQKV